MTLILNRDTADTVRSHDPTSSTVFSHIAEQRRRLGPLEISACRYPTVLVDVGHSSHVMAVHAGVNGSRATL